MTPNKTNHPSRKGIEIKSHKGGRTVWLPTGKITPAEWEVIEKLWNESGQKSWSDFVVFMSGRNPTPFALDGATLPDNQQVFPADVLVGEGTLPEPPRQ